MKGTADESVGTNTADTVEKGKKVERPDGKVFHRDQAGDESDEYSSGDIAPDEDGFLGEAIDDHADERPEENRRERL